MQSNIEEAKADMQRMEAKYANDAEIARAKRDFDTKKATYDVEVYTAKAEAELAYELQVGRKSSFYPSTVKVLLFFASM